MADRRAVVFDLDDTLYPLRDFVQSGFGAVAAHVGAATGVDPALALHVMASASARDRGRELQALAEWAGLPADAVPGLVAIIRRHVPALRLPELSRAVLRLLRRDWRLGIVTNGRPDIQERKIRALGLAPLVDVVVYADALGAGCAKPAAAPFLEIGRRLGVAPGDTVFVGNDPATDIAGAYAVGMHTIHLIASDSVCGTAPMADAAVASLADVPAAAGRLRPAAWRAHVA